MILLFARYDTGVHVNTVHENVNDALEVVERYLEELKRENGEETTICGYESFEELQEDVMENEAIGRDNFQFRLDNGTWFVVTFDVPRLLEKTLEERRRTKIGI